MSIVENLEIIFKGIEGLVDGYPDSTDCEYITDRLKENTGFVIDNATILTMWRCYKIKTRRVKDEHNRA